MTIQPATGLPASQAGRKSHQLITGNTPESGDRTLSIDHADSGADAQSPAPRASDPTSTPKPQQPPEHSGPPATPPLAGDPPAERHRLSPRVTRYWRWRAFFSAFPILVFVAGVAYILPWGAWWLRWGIVAILIATIAIGMVVLPPIRYRVFYYAISPTEIDIQHKIIFIERIVIPMHRVQSLRTERGPMADHYQMTNLKISTAGGSVTISGLDRREADDLCDRISELAKIVDDV